LLIWIIVTKYGAKEKINYKAWSAFLPLMQWLMYNVLGLTGLTMTKA